MTDKPTVFEAWSRVMEDVQAIGKNQRNNAPERELQLPRHRRSDERCRPSAA